MSERTKWNSNFTFLMAMIGAAVGLGNIWRFPYVFYSNGQGSFLIPYLVAILILGLPFMLLEYSIGIKFKNSVVDIFEKINPKFKSLAWLLLLISFLIVTYYMCIVGWDLNYIFISLTKGWGANPDAYFNGPFLQSDLTFNGLFHVVPYILIAVAVLWFVLWLISSRDLNEGIGTFTTIFVPLLFILGIGIAIYNVTLPGASIGYMRFFQPDWSLLLNFKIWLAAFSQILFSLSLGIGVILSYSSHLPDDTNLGKNALIVIIANCGFEVINAIGIFSILGFMSHSTGLPIESLITEGSGLAFIAFPDVMNVLGFAGYIIGPLFFFCILIAGLTTAVSYVEPLIDTLDSRLTFSRKKIVTIICIIGFLSSIIYCTGHGNFLIKVNDEFLNNIILMIAVILQCIVFAYFYKLNDLVDVINRVPLFKVGSVWINIIKYVLPILLFILLITGGYDLIIDGENHILTYLVLVFVIIISILFLNKYVKKK